MTTLYVYVGLSGSGKTHIAYKQHSRDAVIIDSDMVRARICPGGAEDQSMNARVFEHMYTETCECLAKDTSVCYVATNLSARRRINLLISLKKKFPDVEYVCVVINTPIKTCYERNAARERHVPYFVISKQLRTFQVPTLAEGFSRIEVVDNYDDAYDVKVCTDDIVKQVMGYGSQGNKHHSLTLYDHCKKCGDTLYVQYGYGDLARAGYIHDYGKIYTVTQWPEKDDDLHYPNHSEVGSYLALNMGFSLHVAQLVGFHMYPYTDEKAQATWRKRAGEELWSEVMQLHMADVSSH